MSKRQKSRNKKNKKRNPCLLYRTPECLEPKMCKKGSGSITWRDGTRHGKASCSNYLDSKAYQLGNNNQIKFRGLENEANSN